ncbi:MAG: C10 family peptidase [Acidobacteria bacterium]|nr:C10 family peptidase [Acidobacteriota bacterium]
MKKYFIYTMLVCIFIFPFSAIPEKVNLDKAELAADSFIATYERMQVFRIEDNSLASFKLGRTIQNIQTISGKKTPELLIYVVHLKPKGFIALSSDTRIEPIIAYSFNSNFPSGKNNNNILYHMLIADVSNRFAYVQKDGKETTKDNEDLWSTLISEDGDAELLAAWTEQWPAGDDTGWLDTIWAQGSYTGIFNDACPDDPNTLPGWNTDDGRCVTGCVATAMAQIVNYWEYPSSVTFTAADNYTSVQDPGDGYGIRTIPITATTANMSMIDYNGNGVHPTDSTIASLMCACGVSVKMQYSDKTSVSFTSSVAGALKNKFGYGYARVMSPIANPDFYVVLEDDMKKGRPAQLGISTGAPDEGHSIVCDGYRDDNTFHLNFGWGDPWWDPVANQWVYMSEAWYNLPTGMPAGYNTVTAGVLNIDPCIWVPDFYADIQSAINAANTGNTIKIRAGTYTGTGNKNLDFDGKTITVRGEACPGLTIIDCEDSGRGFYFHSGESSSAMVRSLTIKNGNADWGGAIRCEGSSPTIYNCIITENFATGGGGISCNTGSNPLIRDCLISDNSTDPYSGGGIYCYDSEPTILKCLIEENYSDQYGGGIYFNNSSMPLKTPAVYWCRIRKNNAQKGGGIYSQNYSSVQIKNCLFVENETWWSSGAGICLSSTGTLCSPIISNCTFKGNKSVVLGGGMNSSGNNATITDCIMWGNNPDNFNADTSVTVDYCDIKDGTGQPWFDSLNCIDADPLFVKGPLNDCCLSQTVAGQSSNSPCVDTGSANASSNGMDNFSTRTDRVTDSGIVDMGYHADPDDLYINSITVNGNDVTIQWNSLPNMSYCVYYSLDMQNWTHVHVGKTNTWTHTGGALVAKYYCVWKE